MMKRIRHVAASNLDLAATIGFVLLVYALTFTRVSSYDALCYYKDIESSRRDQWVHPHHLLYLPALKLWYSTWRALGYDGTSILPLRIFSLLGASGALAAYAHTCRRFLSSRTEIRAVILLFGFTFLMWHFATQVEPVSFFFFFAIVNLNLMLEFLAKPRLRARDAALAGGLNALGALFHQSLLLACPFSLALLWIRAGWRSGRHLLLTYLAVVGAGVLLPYLWVGTYLAGARGASGLYTWATSFFHQFDPVGFGRWSNVRIMPVLHGLSRAMVGGMMLKPYVYGGSRPDLRFYLAFVPLVSVWLFVALGLTALLSRIRQVRAGHARQILLLALWILVFGTAAAWWEPGNRTFWAPTLPCIFLLAGLGYSTLPVTGRSRLVKQVTLSAAVLLLLVGNLAGGIWAKHATRDEDEPFLVELKKRIAPGDVVIVEDGRLWQCLNYFYPEIRVFPIPPAMIAEPAAAEAALQSALAAATEALLEGHAAYVTSEVLGAGRREGSSALRTAGGIDIQISNAYEYEHEYMGNAKQYTMYQATSIAGVSSPPSRLAGQGKPETPK